MGTAGATFQRGVAAHTPPPTEYLPGRDHGRFTPPRILGIPQGLFGLTHDLIAKKEPEPDNDGLVSVASATMGRPAWTPLATWEVNHARMVNQGTNLVPTLHELADSSIIEKYRALANQITAIA